MAKYGKKWFTDKKTARKEARNAGRMHFWEVHYCTSRRSWIKFYVGGQLPGEIVKNVNHGAGEARMLPITSGHSTVNYTRNFPIILSSL